jgi:AcrR family transcriptional regulator
VKASGSKQNASTKGSAKRNATKKVPVVKAAATNQGAAKRNATRKVPVVKAAATKQGAAKRNATKKVPAKRVATKKIPAKRVATKKIPAKRVATKKVPASGANGRKGRPVHADSAATRLSIVNAATWVFGMHGYEGSSMQAVAERAGITAPTLYHYFPSKVAIFQTVGDEVLAESKRRADAATTEPGDARRQIAAILRALGEWIVERPEIASFIASYAAEVARNREVRRVSPAERWTDPIEYYAKFARDGLERGEIVDDLEPETIAGLVQGLIYGMSALVAVSRSFGPPDLIVAAFARAIEGTVFVDP